TFNWPICRYSRSTIAGSLHRRAAFEDAHRPIYQLLLPVVDLVWVDPKMHRQLGDGPVAPDCRHRHLCLERRAVLLPCPLHVLLPRSPRFLGAGLHLSHLSHFRGPAQLSNTLGADFCVEALEEALARYGRPEIFNTDQGSQFTSDDFTGILKRHGVAISMDGKGRCMDNIFVERLWRSLKYEEVYLHAYATVAEAKAAIGAWLDFYNTERQHQSLGYRTPRQIYQEGLWICGRSALPTGCASPASRASSESGEMLAFAHIPTGTANQGFDID